MARALAAAPARGTPNARIVQAGIGALVEQLNAEGGTLDDLLEEVPTVVGRYGLVARLAGVRVDRVEFNISWR
jgi:hypothetical protein